MGFRDESSLAEETSRDQTVKKPKCPPTSVEGDLIITERLEAIDGIVETALTGSSLAGFRHSWRKARSCSVDLSLTNDETRWVLRDIGMLEAVIEEELRVYRGKKLRDRVRELRARVPGIAEATASNSIAELGRLLGGFEAKKLRVPLHYLPESVLRRPWSNSLLDVAVGASAIEVAKYLLEFHEVTPTRDTLKMALATGNPELIRLIWQRLPEGDRRRRDDLLEVAADYHREAPLAWLHRDATGFERELFALFALERHLADALLIGLQNGLRPWWGLTRERAGKWPEAAELEFFGAPEGFSVEGGWWTDVDGASFPLTECDDVWRRPEALDPNRVAAVSFPTGAKRIGSWAFRSGSESLYPMGSPHLARVTIPSKVTVISTGTFCCCNSLREVVIPEGVTEIWGDAFLACGELTQLVIPSTVEKVGTCSIRECEQLIELVMPASLEVGGNAFKYDSDLFRILLVGAPLSDDVIEYLDMWMTGSHTKIYSKVLAGRELGGTVIIA
jgi:hypothetical protein